MDTLNTERFFSENPSQRNDEKPVCKAQAASYPLMSKPAREDGVKETVSAPGIMMSKFQIKAFLPPVKTPPPEICDGDPMGDDLDEVDMEFIFCPENISSKNKIEAIIEDKVPKTIPHGQGRTFYIEMMIGVIRFASLNKMSEKKALCLTRIFAATHRYFIADPWRLPAEVFEYFRELVLRHVVQHPPRSVEILSPEDCPPIMRHFHRTYLRLLPVIRSLCAPNFRLRLPWKNVPPPPPPPARAGKSAGKGKKKKGKK